MIEPILCIAGPTAAGKSAAVSALAKRWAIEIIAVDSATIYRGMDIGTAKPSAEERARIPHHLLDIRDPAESYSAAEFRADALSLIAAIKARGNRPVLCGGTMLYYKALREGLDDLPPANPEIRAQLDAQAAEIGWPGMHDILSKVDPLTAARLSPNDSQRIQRALEIWHISGKPMSSLLGRHQAANDSSQYITVSLEPSNRLILHERIAQRYRQMLDEGLLDEVRALRRRGDLRPDMPSIRCVGYRQLWDHLDGKCTLEQAIEQAIAATRQLAKRQLTWLRSLHGRITIDCLSDDVEERVIEAAAGIWGE